MTKKKKKGSIKDWNKERKRGFSNIHSTWSARKNGGGFLLAFLLHHCVWSLIKAMNLLQKLSSSFFLLSLPPWPSTKPLFMQKFFNFLLKFSKWWLTIKAVHTTLQDDATHPSPCLGWDTWPQFLLSFTRSQHGKHCYDSWFRGLGTLKIEILLKVRMFDELGFHSCHHCQVASEIVFCILQAALLCFAWRLC